MTGIPEITGRWWQTILAFFTLVGMTSGGLVYYAKAETSHLIQVELADPIKDLNQKLGIQQDKLQSLQSESYANKEKLNLIIDMMKMQNKVLDQQQKSIEAIPDKVKE
jgi:hypothetical protein